MEVEQQSGSPKAKGFVALGDLKLLQLHPKGDASCPELRVMITAARIMAGG